MFSKMSVRLCLLLCISYVATAMAKRSVLQSPSPSTSGPAAMVRASGEARGSSGSVVTTQIVVTTDTPAAPVDPLTEMLTETVSEALTDIEGGQSVDTVAEEMAVAYAMSVAEIQADVIVEGLEEGDECAGRFPDSVETATPFARTLVAVLSNASTYITFADMDDAITAIAEVTAPLFAEAEALACEIGDDVTAIAESLTPGLTEPYTEVMSIAFAAFDDEQEDAIAFSVSANDLDASFVEVALAPDSMEDSEDFVEMLSSLETSFPPCSSRFVGCCASQRDLCRCGARCEAVPYDFGNSALFGYEVTVASSLGPEEGEICVCS